MDTKNKGNSAVKCFAIILAYWALILFGPILVMLFNAARVWFSGMGFFKGSFGYKALVFLAQTLACIFACEVAESISSGKHQVCVFVNQIVTVSIFVFIALSMFFLQGEILNGVQYVLASTVTIIYSVKTAKTLKGNTEES